VSAHAVRARPAWMLELSWRWWGSVLVLWVAFMLADRGLWGLRGTELVRISLTKGLLWSALVWVGVAAARRWPLYGPGWRARVPLNLAAWLGLVVLHVTAQHHFDRVMLGAEGPYWVAWLNRAPGGLIIHMHVLGIAHAAYFSRRWRERAVMASAAQAQLARKRLEILRSRLRPELVYRALDRVTELAGTDPRAADRLVASLGDLLRRALRAQAETAVPFAAELGFVEAWIAVENAVREHPLRLDLDADGGALGVAVPPLLLQPVVEVLVYENPGGPRPRHVRIRARTGPGGEGLRIQAELAHPAEGAPPPSAGSAAAEALRRYYGPAVEVEVFETSSAVRVELAVAPVS
jgi:Histidine kinase